MQFQWCTLMLTDFYLIWRHSFDFVSMIYGSYIIDVANLKMYNFRRWYLSENLIYLFLKMSLMLLIFFFFFLCGGSKISRMEYHAFLLKKKKETYRRLLRIVRNLCLTIHGSWWNVLYYWRVNIIKILLNDFLIWEIT